MSAALAPVERPVAVLRAAVGTLSCAGPAAVLDGLLHDGGGTTVFATAVAAAVAALPDALHACARSTAVVIVAGLLPWRARLLVVPLLLIGAALGGYSAAPVAVGVGLSAMLERGAPSMSASSRLLQWATTAALGGSLLAVVLTLQLAASGSWAPLPWSGDTPMWAGSSMAQVCGALGVVTGVVWVWWCARALIAGGGTPDPCAPPQQHCSSGPYASTSHPMQRGQWLVLLGLALLLNTTGAVLVSAVLALLLLGPVRLVEARAARTRQADDTAPSL